MMTRARTIVRPLSLRGPGMFSRRPVELRMRPAERGAGLSFRPGLKVEPNRARAGVHCTVLTRRQVKVSAVEHLLAACAGLGVTDVEFDCPGGEPPFGDGSSLPFVRALLRAGLRDAGLRLPMVVREPALVQADGGYAIACPGRGLRVTCVTNFPWVGPESFEWTPGPGRFERELAGARTVALTRESATDLGRELGLRFALCRRGEFVLPARPRMAGEACRHKLLDLLGDLVLLGRPVAAHLFVFRPGHRLNLELVRRLDIQKEER
ncbi:MAG TPA: hypothetical protein ENN51_08900 [candidate division WOR-3 bacterium]|uniref:UDP-3-O-acyl-N-acetylglucosamine deacetylase n=1 Tax=candidate division WOR-3 bacterium TaxID=2052148 RepID=A0A7V0T736_UNCW3|nr:hypothetical protein [candidate division WOR-3 bacterium]